ncbi:MAG TPA: RNA methyltransferase [Desulfovibrio sp.]|nr:RNA methyltransferase [Desulfovibrio sp.]
MNPWKDETTLLVTCPKALPVYLAEEMRNLGMDGVRELVSGVECRGTLSDCLKLNLEIRTGHRVLYELARFRASGPDELYAGVAKIPWEELIPADGYVSVSSALRTEAVRDSRFANLKLKDALVDRVAAKKGRRPDSGPNQDRTCVFLYWQGSDAAVYLDATGDSLSRRGWRTMPGKAPLQETLAAGMLLAAGWPGIAAQGGRFLDPMCGSGTLAVEAAHLAQDRAPGLARENFAFMHVPGYRHRVWEGLLRAAEERVRDLAEGRFLATDKDPAQMAACHQNATRAGVDELLRTRVCDFRDLDVPPGPGLVIVNPEYGVRLGDEGPLRETYKALGDFLKQRCQGWRAAILCGNPDLARHVGLKPSRRIPFWNAKIECRLLVYELYAGSRKRRDGS